MRVFNKVTRIGADVINTFGVTWGWCRKGLRWQGSVLQYVTGVRGMRLPDFAMALN